jgi:DNA-binding LacI/PurR family transcriptional regulator
MGRYLAGCGHRRAIYLTCFSLDAWSVLRFKGLQQAFLSAGGDIRLIEMDVNSGIIYMKYIPAIQRTVESALSRILRPAPFSPLSYFNIHHLSSLVHNESIIAVMRPLFERALAVKDASVWIADNDVTALGALVFLKRKGIAVPKKISVAGFDNTRESQVASLTSYDFNIAGAAHACLSFIYNPSLPQWEREKHSVIIEGRVIPRSSTSPPARSDH